MLQRRLHPCQNGAVVAMLHAVEKTTLVALTSLEACRQAAVKWWRPWQNDESLQVRVRKAHPPEGRATQHPSAHKGDKTGCL